MSTRSAERPDVSVVVIVYNDAKRLPTAVASVLRQTLRNLEVIIADDCSTDDTAQVAAELCASDPRVRYVRLPQNSGGCGAPRNTGVAQARGEAIMFLDSDDRYERHACKNLLEALEDADADFSMGLTRREYMDTKRQTRWYPELFEQRRVVNGIHEEPRLITDTLSVNKLYRRDFLIEHGLSFPEDIHYEDQVFTIAAYQRARRIAVIPENVYLWRIYPTSAVKSITNQRHELANFLSRREANVRIDAFLREAGDAELARVKDIKFLEHDLRLYLQDAIYGDATVVAAVLEEAEAYLRSIPAERFLEIPVALRAAVGMALRRDVAGLREVMLLDRRNILASRVGVVDGHTYLSARSQAPGPDPRFALDAMENRFLRVDGWNLLEAPAGSYHLAHEVTSTSRRGRTLVLVGRSFDALGKLAGASGDWQITLRARLVGRSGLVTFDVVPTHVDAEGVRWRVEIPPLAELAPVDPKLQWRFTVATRIGARTSETRLIWPREVPPEAMTVPLVSRTALGLTGTIGPDVDANAEIRLTTADDLRKRVANRVRKRYVPLFDQRVRRPWRDPWSSDSPLARLYAAWRRMPLDPRLVVFEANLGTVYGDSPKYVFEALRRLRPDLSFVWALPDGHEPPAPGVKVVRRGSPAYLRALARASYWVDNQTFPAYVRKRPGQRYLQTWHGIPLKRMGRHIEGAEVLEQLPDRGIGAWDQLVVSSDYFERTLAEAFSFRGERLRYGTPRNDVLVNGTLTREQARVRLDLPADARVVLYAPTFRESAPGRKHAVTVPFDVPAVLDGLGEDTYLLLRPHYLNRVHVPPAARYRAIDVGSVEDVNLLYVAADVLVTDYSSVMFDFALLRKPMVFYTYDYEEYLATRGTYFDLREEGPGRFAADTEALIDALHTAEEDRTAMESTYERFIARYCGQEDGLAAERVALRLLDGGAGDPASDSASGSASDSNGARR